MKLQGKTAVVTGAGSGMGKAIALLFAQEGAKVVAADINQAGVDAVVAEIREKGGEATAAAVNVSRRDDVEAMIRTAADTYGSLTSS